MKKQAISLWAALTLIFGAFTAGYFLGRSRNVPPVQLSLPATMLTEPALPQPVTTRPEETEPSISFPVNLNTADTRELTALPGIGPVLAERILAYRAEHGTFETVEALMNVEGIGQKRLEEILDFITIGG